MLAFGSEEAAVPQLAEDSRALHRGLEPLQKTLAVFTVSERYIRQRKPFLFSPGGPVASFPRELGLRQVYHSVRRGHKRRRAPRADRVLSEHALEDVAADVAVLLEGEALEVAVVSK